MSDKEYTETHGDFGDEALAVALDISLEDLKQLQWTVDVDIDGKEMINEFVISFRDDSPKAVLDKIKDLANDNSVRLSPAALRMS